MKLKDLNLDFKGQTNCFIRTKIHIIMLRCCLILGSMGNSVPTFARQYN